LNGTPVDANAIKGAGPGIWEELFGYIGLGYRVLSANAIRQLAQLWTYSTMSGRGGCTCNGWEDQEGQELLPGGGRTVLPTPLMHLISLSMLLHLNTN
jgi:hypothetical protein